MATSTTSKSLIDPKAKALIFDLDGTLIDSLEINWRAMDTALREQGIVIERDEFIGMTGRSIEEITRLIVERHGKPGTDCDAIVARKREIANGHADDVDEIKVIADVARSAKGVIPMAIGTGSDRHRAELMLTSTGLIGLFDYIVAADDVEHHKPHPETFLKCAELMGIAPAECQVFEDGDTGIEAARKAGMIITDVRPYI